MQRTLVDGFHIFNRHTLANVGLNTADTHPLSVDLERRRAESQNSVTDGLLRAVAEGNHGNHGRDADDTTEHCQQRAQRIRAKRGVRDSKNLKLHYLRSTTSTTNEPATGFGRWPA